MIPRALVAAAIVLALGLAACAGGERAADSAIAGQSEPPAVTSAPYVPIQVGEPSPAYAIATMDGDSLVLGPSDRVTLLNVWATWCVSCKEEFAFMDTLLMRHASDGLRIVAVSVDVGSPEAVARVARQYAVTFEVAHDPEGRVEQQFPAIGVPASYLVGRDGRLLWKHVGVMPPAVDSVIAEALKL